MTLERLPSGACGLHSFLVTPAGQLHIATSEVVVPIRLPPFQLLISMRDFHGTHGGFTVSTSIPEKSTIHVGVSLNGGTPKTPQNDHF